jgi:DNA-binding response OmpR family regulator
MEIPAILTANINKVTERKELLMTEWSDDSFFNSRNPDVYIRKLLQHFREDNSIIIQTLKKKGYLFLVPTGNE